jgi:hypothetical protein
VIRKLTPFAGALILLASALHAQCPNAPAFPSAIATDANLTLAANNVATTLSVAMSSTALSATVTNPSGWQPNMLASVDNEIMFVTAVNGSVLTVSRPCEGTLNVSHAAGRPFTNNITAGSHELMKKELEAVETLLGGNGGLKLNQTVSTPQTAGVNQILVTDGANNGSGTQTGQALRVVSTYGGSNMTGIRNAIESDILMSTAPSASDTDPGYVAILGTAQVLANMGGTSGSPRGAYWGGSDFVMLGPSATDINGVVGREIDWGGDAGSSMAINTGLSLVAAGAVHGSSVDAALNFGSAAPGFATNYLMYIGDFHSGAAVGTNTTILGTDTNAHLAKSGIDFGAYGFTNYVFHSNYFFVDGAGNVTQSVPVTGYPVKTEWFGVNSELYVGTESSAGGSLLAGSTPYAGIINQLLNYPLQFGTNNAVRMTISASGTVAITGQSANAGTITCYKTGGVLGYATMSGGNISVCN